MCGISCQFSEGSADDTLSNSDCGHDLSKENSTSNEVLDFLARRGPDLATTTEENLDFFNGHLRVQLSSYVLWTQGESPHPQPFTNADKTKLMLFNGDIYSFDGFDYAHESESWVENDGLRLFRLLEKDSINAEEMCSVISKLQGPFAFILVDKITQDAWFCRDFFGRESLLFSYEHDNKNENNCQSSIKRSWTISSVSVYKNVCEVPTFGLFGLNLKTQTLTVFPYSHSRTDVANLNKKFLDILLNSGLVKSIKIKDSIVIKSHFSPKLRAIELGGNSSGNNLQTLLNEARVSTSAVDFIRRSLIPLSSEIEQFLFYMRQSIKRRVSTLPPYCKSCMETYKNCEGSPEKECNHAKVGVLFSGGLDSTVIAYLAAEALCPGSTLDLINVAFSKTDNFSNIPDRETALVSYKMLRETFPGVNINLVLVNVQKPEVVELRRSRIKYLISPLNSVLDDSLGVCLWFAARGKGKLYSEDSNEDLQNYTSPMRIVLLGSGADELLGGYGRHRSAYERSGWLGLHSEMQLEIDRISIRNLGRDNRIVSDHGLCPRMPFLDENLVDFLTQQCELWVKCCPVNEGPLKERGSGEKLLLRAVGAYLFGEEYISLALFPKRAMQFGSRIAKLEDSKEKGGDSCQRLL